MRPGWYSENLGRSYPLVRGTLDGLPKDALVDAGFLVGAAMTSPVRLRRVELIAGRVIFTATYGGAPGDLVFTAAVGDRQRTLFADSDAAEIEGASEGASELVSEGLSEGEVDCEAIWSGFLVVGDLAALAALVAGGPWVGGPDDGLFEPALVQNVAGAFVTGVTVANADRTRVDAPDGCPPQTWPFAVGADRVVRRCLEGDLRFADGYNVAVGQSAVANALVFNAGVGLGLGAPCADVVRFPGETPPDDSTLYGGGPACGEVMRRLNGAPGPLVDLQTAGGVTITPDPDNHRVVIDVNLADLLRCTGSELDSEGISEGA